MWIILFMVGSGHRGVDMFSKEAKVTTGAGAAGIVTNYAAFWLVQKLQIPVDIAFLIVTAASSAITFYAAKLLPTNAVAQGK